MKNLFFIKRNMHRLVNILFYGGFFVAGYICAKGMGFKIEMLEGLFKW